MTALLGWLKSFIDLQKAASITVPGVVAAFAVILLAWPSGSLVFEGYPFERPGPVRVPAICDALSQETATVSGGEGRMTVRDYSSVQARRWQIEDCVRQLQALIIADQQNVASLGPRIDLEQKRATEAQAKYVEYRDKFNTLADGFKRESELSLAAAGLLRDESKASEARVAFYTALSGRWADEQKRITERLDAVNAGEVFADLVGKVTQRLLYVAILAVTIGFILDPFNKAIFSVFYSTDRVKLLNARLGAQGIVVVPPSARAAAASRAKPYMLNVNYALGLKLISQDDVNALENRYYYSALLSVGMILPTALLLIATALFVNSRYPDDTLRQVRTREDVQRAVSPVQPAVAPRRP
jgi:hypothetical protein